MEWLPGMVELGQIDHEEMKSNCLQLNKNIYGMVDAVLIFYKAYSVQLMKSMGMTQSKADACMFTRQDETGKTILIMSSHVDDIFVAGTPDAIAWFKQQLKERFNIKEMGRIIKHLGIKYAWQQDEAGQECVVATMKDFCEEIVTPLKKNLRRMVKKQDTMAEPNKTNEQDKLGIVNDKMYRSIVGKIM